MSGQPLKILILEDSETDAELLQRVLKKDAKPYLVQLAGSRKEFIESLDSFRPDVILSDNSLPQFNASDALKIVRARDGQLPFILVTGTVSDEYAANIIKSGADDYILKDRLTRLPVAIEAAVRQRQVEREHQAAAERLRLSEESYRNMMSRVSDAFISLDREWRYTYLNKQAGEMIKMNPGELIGKNVWEVFPQAVGSSTFHAFQQAMREQRFISNTDYYAPLDLWQENNIYPSENGLSVFIRDISERKKAEKAIVESEQKYRTLVEQAFDAIITYTQEGIITSCNQTACAYSGYGQAELIGLPVMELFFKEDLIEKPIDIERLKQGNPTLDYRRVKRKDKGSIEVEISTKKMPNGNLVAIARDITERKKAEVALQKSEEKYRTIFLKSPLPNWVYDLETLQFLDVNDAAIRHYGYSREEFMNMTIMDIRPAEDHEPVMADIMKITTERDLRQGQWRHLNKSGAVIIVETTAHSIDYNGRTARMVIAKDITEKIKSEQALQQSEKRLKQAQAVAHLGHWSIDFKSGLSAWSDEAYRIYGITPGEHKFSFDDWLKFIHPADLARVNEVIAEAGKSFADISIHHRIIRPDGTVRYVYSEAKYEFNSQGAVSGLYGIVLDETANKEAEEEIRKSNERFQYATKASSDIIWELNFETRQYLIHEGKQKLFGMDTVVDWATGVDASYIIEEDRERVRTSFREARKDPSRTLWELEYRLYKKDHSVLHIINHAIFIRDAEGRALKAIGALTDITARKKLEEDLLEQQRQEQSKIIATALEAQEKERTAIGIELHDNVNQIIVGTILLLSMSKKNPETAGETITAAINNLQEAIKENRKIAHVFVAPDLESETLSDQLRTLAGNMLETSGIRLRMIATRFDEKCLKPDMKINIYRIAQEQCTNIVKYAKATAVDIKLTTNKKQFKMIIADNGVGMDAAGKTSGIGLRNIRGRLSIFNGTERIITAPGKGFSLEIIIPLAPETTD